MNIEIVNAYREWFRSYPFNIFSTLTFEDGFPKPRGDEFKAARAAIGKTLSRLGKGVGAPVAAMGVVVNSHSDLIHSHLCVWIREKQANMPLNACAALLDHYWSFSSETTAIRSKRDVTGYIASPKHLIAVKGYDFFEHGPNILKKLRRS